MSIKNIIFDFGGVIYDIDMPAAADAFRDLGIKDFEQKFTEFTEANIFDRLETGHLTPEEFRDEFRKISGLEVSDHKLDGAWNALLIGFREERIRLIESIKEYYNIFLLSNSNIIHYKRYRQEFEDEFGYKTFDELFLEAFFSFEIGMRKPDHGIYEYVADKLDVKRSETLFIDDTEANIIAARETGLRGKFLDLANKEDLMDLFTEAGKLKESGEF